MPLIAHFLNVGHGDCTVVQHPSGRVTVIDMNNGSELDPLSLMEIGAAYGMSPTLLTIPSRQTLEERGYLVQPTNPVQFLAREYPRGVFRYIQTHPDMDHMRGLTALVNAGLTPGNFWDTEHSKEPELQERDVEDWETYLALRNGHYPSTTVIRPTHGSRARYYNLEEDGSLGGDGIEILSPSPELIRWANENEQWNELSYVLRISHGGRSMILGGDAGEISWRLIHQHYGRSLSCQVLKASHHGRDTGYYQKAVEAMSPAVTVVSVGKKPATDASNKYKQYSDEVWSTRWKGNITITFPDSVSDPFLYGWQYDR